MRALVNLNYDYGHFQNSSDFVQVWQTSKGKIHANDPEVDFTFDMNKEDLYTTQELNAIGHGHLVIQQFVLLDKESTAVLRANIKARNHITEIVEYEVRQRVLETSSTISRPAFEITNVWVTLVPYDLQPQTMIRDAMYTMLAGKTQRFPFGVGFEKYYGEFNNGKD